MTENSATLPADWPEFLAEVQRRLEDAVALVGARFEQMPMTNANQPAQERFEEVARLEASLSGLGAQLESAEQLVREVDQELESNEQALRRQSELSGSVRQRLVAWAGRAIE
jgi:hypothetical protein